MFTLIKSGTVIDPLSKREGIYDILIEDDKIVYVADHILEETIGEIGGSNAGQLSIIYASGKYVMPGFIDMHVHLREPGFEYKETIRTGSQAAAAGGFTTICAMPNTKPVTDSAEIIKLIQDKAVQESPVNVLLVGAVTLGQLGNEVTDIEAMVKAGAVAISEDGKSVMNAALYKRGMQMAAKSGIPVLAHCEDKNLVGSGVLNAGAKAGELGMEGISNAVEDVIVARDILLAKETGAKLHLCHCSTMDSVKMLGIAKEEGLPVSGEVCPHHFTLSEEDIISDDANYKMNPPLRTKKDAEALKQALKNNIIDVIATDHAPHSEEEKQKSIKEAPFGIVGLETAFALTLSELVETGYLTKQQMVEKLSVNPAKILGIKKGCIGEGYIADIVIADPEEEYEINKNLFFSKGRNTPFHGRRVKGRVLYTFVAGKMVYKYNKDEEGK